jgi:hypothetical protein
MLLRLSWPCALMLVASTSALAQTAGASGADEPSLWNHNGSVVSLTAQGSAREFYYKEPRPGMVQAGARPGALLFRGQAQNDRYAGTAYLYAPGCGQFPYPVSGHALEGRIVLVGEAPIVGEKCRVRSHREDTLQFTALDTGRQATKTVVDQSVRTPEAAGATASAAVRASPAAETRPERLSPEAPRTTAAAVVAAAPPEIAATSAAPLAPLPDLNAEIARTRAEWKLAHAQAQAAAALERSAQRAVAEAQAGRLAAEQKMQRIRAELEAALQASLQERSTANLILGVMAAAVVLSGAALIFLLVRRRLGARTLVGPGQAVGVTPQALPDPELWQHRRFATPRISGAASVRTPAQISAEREAHQAERVRLYFRTGAAADTSEQNSGGL